MVFEQQFKMGIKDIGNNNFIKNRAILEMLENIGAYHSDLAGYGAGDIEKTHVAWILAGWKLNVIKRPKYGQTINIKTWGRDMSRATTYRDFEVFNEQGKLCAIATSKWVLVNTKTGKLTRITEEIANKYKPEENNMFFASTKATHCYSDVDYSKFDEVFVLYGKETKGLPEDLLQKYIENTIRIPMRNTLRSLNLSNSVAIITYEILRQINFNGLQEISDYF